MWDEHRERTERGILSKALQSKIRDAGPRVLFATERGKVGIHDMVQLVSGKVYADFLTRGLAEAIALRLEAIATNVDIGLMHPPAINQAQLEPPILTNLKPELPPWHPPNIIFPVQNPSILIKPSCPRKRHVISLLFHII